MEWYIAFMLVISSITNATLQYHQVYIGGDPYSGFVGEEYPSESEAEDVSEGALHYPSPSVQFFQRSFTDPIEIQSCIGSGIEGYWSGHLFDENKVAIHGMFQFKIESHRSKDRTSGQPKRNFVGAGSYSGGRLQVRGALDWNSRKLHMVVDGQPDYAGDAKLQFDIRGRLSSVKFVSILSKTSVGYELILSSTERSQAL